MAGVQWVPRTGAVYQAFSKGMPKNSKPCAAVVALPRNDFLLKLLQLQCTGYPHYPSPIVLAAHSIFEILLGSHTHSVGVQERTQDILDVCPAEQTH